jgi:signal peptidase I
MIDQSPAAAPIERPADFRGKHAAPGDPLPEARKPSRGAHAAPSPSWIRWSIEFLAVIGVAAVLTIGLRTFVVQTYSIPSASMEPTLKIGDRIVVDKLSYDIHSVGRSDIVVFSRPSNEHCGGAPVADLVKRVIGLPGETISLSDGQVYINKKLLPEPWLPASVQQSTTPGPTSAGYALHQSFKIPTNEVFVMGDNRTDSCDSRWWGPIPESSIVGKVDVRVWPISRVHLF